MSFSAKRPFEPNASEPNGRGKWRKTGPSASQQASLKATPGAVVFRILCPVSKSGSVIGKGGGIISRIREETGAKVRLEETVPGCDERIVVITGSEKDGEVSNEPANEPANEPDNEPASDPTSEPVKEGDENANVADGDVQDDKGSHENVEQNDDSSVSEGSKSQKATSSAQKALLLVFERIIEGEPEEGGGEDEENKESNISVRLLIVSNQVGCLLGKGGSVIKQITADSGAQIRVLSRDKVPSCASAHDEIVQIVGGIDSARKALQLVSQLLIENPPRDPFPAAKPSGPSSHPSAPNPRAEARPPMQFLPPQGPPFLSRPYDIPDMPPFPKFHDSVGRGQIQCPPEQLMFRLLCSNDKVGSVIGRGGSIIKSLQHETACEIKILETTPETDDRIVVVSSPALPVDGISPAQDGVLRVQHRIAMAVPEGLDNVVSRLLVSSNHIGCILGKGGAIISEIRKTSGAQIRILSKEQIPKSAPEHDEVIQVAGELRSVQDALLQITGKLKGLLFRDKVPAMDHAGHPAFFDRMPPFASFMGRREFSPPRMFPNLPPFQKDIIVHPHEERPAFAHPMHGPGVPPHGPERIPPAAWGPQGMREGGSGSMPMSDYPGGGPQRRMGGFPGGNHPAVITSTTVDVVVPRALVPSIYGEDGGCLRRIREISEAKITMTEPRPEATETVIKISGTPEQTNAAQSLIQAFVLSETAAT